MNRIAYGGSPEPEFIIAFNLNGGGAILESVRMLPDRKFDRDSKVWKAPWSAAPQVKAFAERFGFDVTPEAKVIFDATQAIAPASLPRRLTKTTRGLEFIFDYDTAIMSEIKTLPDYRFDPDRKRWWLPLDVVAAASDAILVIAKRYSFIIDAMAQAMLEESVADRALSVSASRALDVSVADLRRAGDFSQVTTLDNLRPFQRAGVLYALRAKRLIIGDPVGLGKTVQSLMTVEGARAFPCLFVCKPVARWQMKDEVGMWLPHRSVTVLSGEKADAALLTPLSDITIVPWSVLHLWQGELGKIKWRSVIPDEVHYAMSDKSQRTKAISVLAKGVPYRIGLTATDVKSRPSELISQLKVIDRFNDIGGWYTYVTRYCAGFRDGWGRWNIKGASNIGELHERLRATCYVRREKKDILTELPDVQPAPVPLDLPLQARKTYDRAEADVVAWLGQRAAERAASAGLAEWAQREARTKTMRKAERMEAMIKVNALKEIAALGKLKSVIEWIDGFLKDTDEKLIVFTDHRAISQALEKEFQAPAIYGGISDKQRERARDQFQNDPEVRLLIANMQSAGESLTLTAANHVAFAEFPWTPADVDQAIGRAYGRLNDVHGVTAWWLIARNTIEERVVEVLGKKRLVTSKLVTGVEAEITEDDMLDALTTALANKAA